MRLMRTSEQDAYYPNNFPYPDFSWMKPLVSSLAFVPFFAILYGFFQRRSARERKLQILFFGIFVTFILLVARVRFPFTILNDFLFQLPGMNALRGYDKLATFLPFIMSAGLLAVFSGLRGVRSRRIVLVIFSVLSVLLALPFYFGGIQTRLSQSLMNEGDKDFRNANYSALVKIPEPYHDIAKIFNEDTEDNKISMLPYSPGSSVGKVNLPVWKVNGPSVSSVLYSKQYVELSGPYIPDWIFAEDFSDTMHDPRWITDIFGLIGVKYIIFHKDAKPERMEKIEDARKYLENAGLLELITENDSFRLYRIEKQRVFPYVYANVGSISFAEKSTGFTERIAKFHDTMRELVYRRIGAQSIIVDIKGLERGQDVFLNEKYDPLWRAEYEASSGERITLIRNTEVKYANAWRIDGGVGSGKIEIYYMPIRLLFIGMWISGVSLVVTVGSLLYFYRKRI